MVATFGIGKIFSAIKTHTRPLTSCETLQIAEKTGGIIIETNEEGRWRLGDKTRSYKFATREEIKKKLGFDLKVQDIGSDVVVVLNPKEISRALVSKNDDVGSAICGFKHEDPKPLIAKKGEHITIEGFENGDWVRVRVYPR